MPILGAFCEEVLEKPGRNAEEAGDVENYRRKSDIGSGNDVIEGDGAASLDVAASLDGAV